VFSSKSTTARTSMSRQHSNATAYGWVIAKKRPENLTESGSIILKQKVEAWARQCEEVGFTPVPNLSRKLHEKARLTRCRGRRSEGGRRERIARFIVFSDLTAARNREGSVGQRARVRRAIRPAADGDEPCSE